MPAIAGVGLPVAATLVSLAPDGAHTTSAALVYVVAVMVAAATAGRAAGIVAAAISALALNFFFTDPVHTLRVNQVEDLVALIVFLFAAAIVAGILSVAIEQRAKAERRETESRLLQVTGDRLLAGVPIDGIAEAFASEVVSLGALECRVELSTHDGQVSVGAGAATTDARLFVIPVRAGARQIGRITVTSAPDGSAVPDLRVVDAFATQLGLALERARLTHEADSARIDAETSSLRAALFSSVTHELRTPLASITAAVTSLQDADAPAAADDRDVLLQTIRQEAQRLNRLVGNLLHLARVRAGAVEAIKVPASINDVIEGSVARLQPLPDGKMVRLLLRADLPEVPMDIDHMDQVVTNLLENAVRHAPPRSEITISSAPWQGAVEVRVSDHGPGIPPDDRERVFEPFVRRDPSREGGAGLGLSIARALVEHHGGSIRIESAPGGGTAVVFRIPGSP